MGRAPARTSPPAGGDAAGAATSGGGAGSGGAGEPGGAGGGGGDTTVRGPLIDCWGDPAPDVPVETGGEVTVTGSDGTSTIADVAAEHVASLVVDFLSPTRRVYGWFHQGLSRRDPISQVYSGLPTRATYFAASAATDPCEGDWSLDLSLGGPDGDSIHQDVDYDDIGQATIAWLGTEEASFTAQGFRWRYDHATALPTSCPRGTVPRGQGRSWRGGHR